MCVYCLYIEITFISDFSYKNFFILFLGNITKMTCLLISKQTQMNMIIVLTESKKFNFHLILFDHPLCYQVFVF